MSRLEDEEVNNIGSVIICCEAKPAPPVPLNKHSIKALIWTKKGQERVTISLKALADVSTLLSQICDLVDCSLDELRIEGRISSEGSQGGSILSAAYQI